MKQIPLTQGRMALVDDQDYDRLVKRGWCAMQHRHTFYAVRHILGGNKRLEQMHRLILGLQPGDGLQCDHRDGDGLNNVQSNLRVCTGMQNHQNQGKWKVGTSKYKGVDWHRATSKWRSRIQLNKKQISLGYFDSEIAAARAYDAAALKYHREFALTNETLKLREENKCQSTNV